MKKTILQFFKTTPRWRLAVTLGLILLAVWRFFSSGDTTANDITFAARRGPLRITVLEGGSIEALQSQEVRSDVKGNTKILKIVEEGYQVTEDDVKNAKVLVELDSSELRSRLTQQEIQFQSSLASLTEAVQGYEIQRNQNTSNIKAAEQKAQFAKMDMQKFLGDTTAEEIVRVMKFDKLEAAANKIVSGEDSEQQMLSAMVSNENLFAEDAEAAGTEAASNADKNASTNTPAANFSLRKTVATPKVDFSRYATAEALGDGSAMQQLRKLTDDLQSAQQQQGLSETKLTGTRKLFAKGFSTKTELDTEEISFRNNELKVKTSETAYNLFIKYEFPKQAQELVSKYEESLRGLEREKKEAISKLAQSRARLKGAESRYNIEATQRKEYQEQLDKCLIKAQKTGLVVYGGGNSDNYFGSEQVREGASVRERQPIITIPDMTQMAVKVKVHESYIQKIKKGLKANIQIDAYPDKKLTGEVAKVALLPDSQNRWMNPDLKVYQTTVNVNGAHEWLKPGMSAKVEILVNELADVVYVPLQAVSGQDGKYFCQVINGKVETRTVETGEFNDEFIEIKSGLQEGEAVLLRAPTREEPSAAKKSNDAKNTKSTAPSSDAKKVEKETPPKAGS